MYAHPLSYAGTTPNAGRLTVPITSVSRPIAAPQREVWALLSDVQNARKWNKAWVRIEFTSGQHHGIGTIFRARMEGGDDFFDFEVCEWSAPERISFCPVRKPGEQLYSITLDRHTFEVHPLSETECEVTISAKATARGIKGRFLAMFFWRGHQIDGLNVALDNIQGIFEPETLNPAADEITALEPTIEE
jgi:uncharacterized protein YndB with AHSA1/START domain